ncbi:MULTISPECIES: PAS domain S-box protein [unclassified Nostoc]|uniref:PAS domain S-box protein n=1 Tax=unclassified Nostoc TaxID=2593658 RepID=UPI002AD8FED5|nr:PAS domain S-box protein [Nostoc sp. DedQUE02]
MRFNDQLLNLPSLNHVINRSPLTINPDSCVVEAIALMSQERCSNYASTNLNFSWNLNFVNQPLTSCVLVMEGADLLGIFTEKDVIRLIASEIDLSTVTMAEVMIQPVITLRGSDSQDIFLALSLLRQHQICHLPVLGDRGQLLGIITEISLLQAFDLIKMVGIVEGLQEYLEKPTDEFKRVNQPIEIEQVCCQTQNYLKLWVEAQSAKIMQVNQELQQALEELQVVEEELREQNEELAVARELVELERQRYQDLFEFAPDAYLVTDTAGIIQEANRAAGTLLAVHQKYLVNKPLILFIAPQDRQTFTIRLNNRQQKQEWEVYLKPRGGKIFPASIRTAAMYDSEGSQVGWRWLLCNISERQQAKESLRQAYDELEQRVAERTAELVMSNSLLQQEIIERQRAEVALRQSENLYRQLVESQTDIIIRIDLQGQITFANMAACQTFGWKENEFCGQSFFQFFHSNDLPKVIESITALESSSHPFTNCERRVFTVKGIRWFQWSAIAIHDHKGEVIEIQGVGRDITEEQAALEERQIAEAALRQSEEKFRTFAENTHALIWIRSADSFHPLYISPAYETIWGYSSQSLFEQPDSWLDNIHPDDRDRATQSIEQLLSDSQSISAEYRILRPDGSVRWVWNRGFAVYNDQGKVNYYGGIAEDITERKLAEQKISEQAALLDITTDAILVRDFQSQILFWNKGAERMYGWLSTEVIGKYLHEILYPPGNQQQLQEALKSVIESGLWHGELHKVTKSGEKIVVESRWTLMRDSQGEPKSILTVDRDITQKKQLEEQFFRTQRLESLGTLAGGIAHDLNNILTPILAAAQLLQGNFFQDEERSGQLMALVETNARRGAALVKQVLSFARGFKGERTIIQIKYLISEIIQIAKHTFPKSIEFSTLIPDDIWAITGDSTQLHQVLMNLVVNARDALPDGGNIKISVENKFIDEAYTRMNLDTKIGHYIVITVTDNGIGIPPEILDRIFEPFFTTKEFNTGTGLGLSTVLGIIKSHDGFIKVSSYVGRGSKFDLFLPALEATQEFKIPDLDLFPGQGELILVVDDEAQIREITTIILENHNYKILTASNGIEAIALYAQHKHQINAVLMDIMMPEMDGITAIRTLQKMNNQVQIIACSGLNSMEVFTQAADVNVQAVLSKPYTARELLNSLHQLFRG